MKYDAEYNSYGFSGDEIYTILWALKFTLWNDDDIHVKDKAHIDNIYSTFLQSVAESAGNELSKN